MYRAAITMFLLAFALACQPSGAAVAKTEKQRYTHPSCQEDLSQCGAIAYGVDGAYVVNPVQLLGRDDMPSGVTKNPHCKEDWETTFSNGLDIGQYDTFVVPGPCEYHLKIQIQLGTKKDRKLYLIPGCQIETKTDGTTLSNDWHVKAVWSDKAKSNAEKNGTTLSGTPKDAEGNNCGTLGNM